MKIITFRNGGQEYFIRPDTSINRERNNYFCLDSIKTLSAVPCIWIKCNKSGKSISSKFAQRYYAVIGYGIRLINNIPEESSFSDKYLANSLDNTWYISKEFPIEQIEQFIQELSRLNIEISIKNAETFRENINALTTNIKTINSFQEVISLFGDLIQHSSKYTSLKTGDYISYDLIKTSDDLIVKANEKPLLKFGEISFKIE